MRNLVFGAAVLLGSAQAAMAQQPAFDVHVHLHNGEASTREYDKQLDATKQRVSGYAAMWFGGPNQALQGKPESIRASNDALIALAAKRPGMVPVATVHPYDGQAALTELDRVAAAGVKVLKIHPHTQRFDASDARVLTLVKRAGELDVVVLMDNANILPGDSEKLFNLALAAPNTKFIFAHLGGLNFRFWNILKAARTAEGLFGNNIYFDISATVALIADSPVEEEFVWTIRNVGVDHVLMGSDYPQYSLERNMSALDRLSLSEVEKSKIRSENARALLGLAALEHSPERRAPVEAPNLLEGRKSAVQLLSPFRSDEVAPDGRARVIDGAAMGDADLEGRGARRRHGHDSAQAAQQRRREQADAPVERTSGRR
jgi:hypothetical protein